MYRIIRSKPTILLAVIAMTAIFHLGNPGIGTSEANSQPPLATTAFFNNGVLGVVGDQRIRYCVGTVSRRGPELDWDVSILDERGALLFRTPEIHSPSGEWRCVDIPRSSIPLPGDPITGRVQVAALNIVRAPAGTRSTDFVGSREIVNPDGTSGAVAAVLYAPLHNNDLS